jgi:rhodanese-related sulfurtransferase
LSASIQRILLIAALGLGALAVIAGSPRLQSRARIDVAALARDVEREDDHVTALELARWIRDRKPGLRVVDVRDSAAFENYHVPGAERIPLTALASATFTPDETIVVYSDGGAHAAQAWVFLRALGNERVYFLRGGLYEWLDDVMNPVISATASDSAQSRFAAVSEISRYFGGVPRTSDDSSGAAAKTTGADAHESAGRQAAKAVRRRGC